MASHYFIILAVLGVMASSTHALTPYATATLNGDKSVPPINTPTTATFVMGNVVGGAIEWSLDVQDVTDLIMAHIHYGNATTNGPPVVNLVPLVGVAAVNNSLGLTQLATPVSGNVKFTATFTPSDFMGNLVGVSMTDFLQDLTAGNLYVNVHTVADVPGLIRGQIGLGGTVSSSRISATAFSGSALVAVMAAAFALVF